MLQRYFDQSQITPGLVVTKRLGLSLKRHIAQQKTVALRDCCCAIGWPAWLNSVDQTAMQDQTLVRNADKAKRV